MSKGIPGKLALASLRPAGSVRLSRDEIGLVDVGIIDEDEPVTLPVASWEEFWRIRGKARPHASLRSEPIARYGLLAMVAYALRYHLYGRGWPTIDVSVLPGKAPGKWTLRFLLDIDVEEIRAAKRLATARIEWLSFAIDDEDPGAWLRDSCTVSILSSRIETSPKPPTKAILRERAARLKSRATPAELIFLEKLKELTPPGMTWEFQAVIYPYIVDFLLSPSGLDSTVIEIDGRHHANPDVIEKDLYRTSRLHQYGHRLKRYPNAAVLADPTAIVLDAIDFAFGNDGNDCRDIPAFGEPRC